MKENGVAKVPCGKLTHVTGCLSLRKKFSLGSLYYKQASKNHKIQNETIKASKLAF